MPSTSDHLSQARSNEKLAELLAKSPFSDWRCTVLYYASLHYIQAYFTTLAPPRRFNSHTARDAAIQRDPGVSMIREDYRSLEDWSRRTRYELGRPRTSDFDNELLPSLQRIKQHLKPYLPGIEVS